MSQDLICALAWYGMTVTMNSKARPCCRISVFDAVELSDYTNSFQDLRENMLAGIKDPRCVKCHIEDESGPHSMRSAANRFFNMDEKHDSLTKEFKQLEEIEFSLDNVCNYQCRMCSSQYSSKLLKRDTELSDCLRSVGPRKVQKSRYETLKELDCDWSKLTSIKLLGGEPFLSPNFTDFLKFLDLNVDLSEVTLQLVTNCSVEMSEEIADLLNKFKFIRLTGSFDSLPKLSEYQRIGSDWHDSMQNFLSYGDMLERRKLIVHQTFTVLNANFIDESLEFYKQYCDSISWSYDDGKLSFLYAPDWYREWILSKVKDSKFRSTIIKEAKYDHIRWHEVLDTIKIFDMYYDTHLEDVNPELADLIKLKTKKYVDAHERPATRDCFYCDRVDGHEV